MTSEARQIALADGRRVHLYVMHALHLDELSLKLGKGTNALLNAFSKADKSETLIRDRPSVLGRKLFGLF